MMVHASGRMAGRTGRHITAVFAKMVAVAVIALTGFGVTSTSYAVTWTAGEIVQALEEAQANGQPFDRLLAAKVREELDKANFQVIDTRLVYTTRVPGVRVDLGAAFAQSGKGTATDFQDLLKKKFLGVTALAYHLGKCEVPIPEGSLQAARTSDIDLSVVFSNSGTYLDLKTTPHQVVFTLGVEAGASANTSLGLEWCGEVAWPVSCQQWVQNPACPPCPSKGPCPPCPLSDICLVPGLPKVVDESWTDWASAQINGRLLGQASLTLDHSFVVNDDTITVGATAKLAGSATLDPTVSVGPVIPDTRLIAVPGSPVNVPHVDKSPLFGTVSAQAQALVFWVKSAPGIDDYTVQTVLTPEMIAEQQARLDAVMAQYFPVQVKLPAITDFENLDPSSQALVKWVLDYLRNNAGIVGEFVFEVVKEHWTEVLYYALTDNRDALTQLFTYQAVCPNLEMLKTGMAAQPLYGMSTGTCSPVDPRKAANGPYYSDAACQTEIAFQQEDFAHFCQETMTPNPNPLLGNAAAWPSLGLEPDPVATAAGPSTKWSLSNGAQLALGVESIKQNHVPYVKRFNYRQVGNCALEMRVYKKDVGATNLTPLLWIHGGAWKFRGGSYVGLESLISSYTEENFVVFTPFYRLVGDEDANQECRNASWDGMVADVEAALDWVKANGAQFGAADTTKIAVTGQSAGAHLAGWLMTHRSGDISRGMLVYPPIDLHDFVARLQGVGGASFPPLSDNTPYDPTAGVGFLEGYLNLPAGGARTINLNAPPAAITANSFAAMVRADPTAFPPAFILHGTRDSLVTHSQSQLLCEAYGGTVNLDWNATSSLRAVFPCGNGSEAHFFKEADHAFEICPSAAIPSQCRAGSAQSAAVLADSLRQGRMWLADRQVARIPVMALAASGASATMVNVTDNNLGTSWTIDGDGQWIQLDLGVAQPISALGIAWNQLKTRFDVQLSSDGAAWQNAYSGVSTGSGIELETVMLGGSSGRYVRIVGHGTAESVRNALSEVRIYGKTPIYNLRPTDVTANANSSKSKNTLDTDLATRWTVAGTGMWISFDLGSQKYLGTVGIAWQAGNTRTANFEILTSLDGNTWSAAYAGTSSGTTLREELYDLPPVAARYVRVVVNGNNLNLQSGIAEVDIYGAD